MSEWQLQTAGAKYLAHRLPSDAAWTSIDAGQGKMDVVAASRRKARGVKRGWPDTLILFGGVLHGLELKTAGEWANDDQMRAEDQIARAGGKYAVARSVADIERALDAWGIPNCLRLTDLQAEQYDTMLAARQANPPKPARPRRKPPGDAALVKRMHGMGFWKK